MSICVLGQIIGIDLKPYSGNPMQIYAHVGHYANQDISSKTQNICITFVQRQPNVFDVGPILYKCYTNMLCLMGLHVMYQEHLIRILMRMTPSSYFLT